jgi:histone-lysine N-methyltransferase SETMAR
MVKAVEEKMSNDRRWTCEELSSELGVSEKSIHRILTEELKMRKICARWVPHCLTQEQMDCRLRISRQLRLRYRREGEDFLRRIITLDETWARCYEPELKSQSAEWRREGSPTPRPKKFRQGPSKIKVMLIVAYDMEGILLVHSVPPKQTVNGAYYRRFLQNHLRAAIRKKRPQRLDDVIILHDNASSHSARAVQEVIDGYGWETLPHPPYPPDLSPCDFHLFPAFKCPMRGIRFESLEAVVASADRCIRDVVISKPTGGIQQLPDRWNRVIESAGDYFEGF